MNLLRPSFSRIKPVYRQRNIFGKLMIAKKRLNSKLLMSKWALYWSWRVSGRDLLKALWQMRLVNLHSKRNDAQEDEDKVLAACFPHIMVLADRDELTWWCWETLVSESLCVDIPKRIFIEWHLSFKFLVWVENVVAFCVWSKQRNIQLTVR